MDTKLYAVLAAVAVLSAAAIFVLGTGSFSPRISGEAVTAMRGGPEAETPETETANVSASVACEPGLFMVWENNIRKDSYDPAADACAGYRCLANGSDVSPACYSLQECVLLCRGECLTPAVMPAGSACTLEDGSVS